MTRTPVLLVEREGGIVTVTLNRPEAMNALDPELVVALARCWQSLAIDGEVRAIVLAGAGDRAFCAGADLKRLIPLATGTRSPSDEWDHLFLADRDLLNIALLRTFDVGKPVIAAIAAPAIGGGAELVQATDLRIIGNDAWLALKEVQWGLFPSGGSTVLLPRQLPWPIAMHALLTGDAIPAPDALRFGLVNAMVPFDQVLDRAKALAARIGALAPLAVQAIRRSARDARCLSIEDGLAHEIELADPVFASRDAAEGVKAFAERRPARFVGA